jgi:hypothetical protein
MYWAGFQWEYDNLKAIRYARKEDAQKASKYIMLIRLTPKNAETH